MFLYKTNNFIPEVSSETHFDFLPISLNLLEGDELDKGLTSSL